MRDTVEEDLRVDLQLLQSAATAQSVVVWWAASPGQFA